MLFDSHCHLDQKAIDIVEALPRAQAAGVTDMMCVGIDLATSHAGANLVRGHAGEARLHFAAGLHPTSADRWSAERDGLAALCAAADCRGVGETGFDFHWKKATREEQEISFRGHLELARSLDKPVIVHSRNAHEDTYRVLADVPGVRGVIHCFSGGVEEARRALDLGYHISFAGPLTYPKAGNLRAAAAFAPLDRILVETDAPFLAPQPCRGRPNEPAYLPHTVAALAAVREITATEAATRTHANACSLFGIDRAQGSDGQG